MSSDLTLAEVDWDAQTASESPHSSASSGIHSVDDLCTGPSTADALVAFVRDKDYTALGQAVARARYHMALGVRRIEPDGAQVLHYAVEQNDATAVRILCGAAMPDGPLDLDAIDYAGRSPLALCVSEAKECNLKTRRVIAEHLLRHGADPLCGMPHLNISQMGALAQDMVPEPLVLTAARLPGDIRDAFMPLLAKYGARLDARDSDGNTIEHVFARRAVEEAVRRGCGPAWLLRRHQAIRDRFYRGIGCWLRRAASLGRNTGDTLKRPVIDFLRPDERTLLTSQNDLGESPLQYIYNWTQVLSESKQARASN